MNKAPGSTLILVTSILLLVLAIIAAIAMLFVAAFLAFLGGIGIILVIISFVVIALEIAAGVAGIKYNNSLDKAGLIFNFAVVLLVLQIISMILSALTNNLAWTSFLGLVLPILYMVGANSNKQAAKSAQ